MKDNPEAPQKNERFIKMTTAPVEKLVLGLAVPSIAIMLTNAFYNMADTFFVSRLGTSQVAAVGIAFPLMVLIQAIGFFFGQGTGNFVARALGAQKSEDASCMAVTGLVSGFVIMTLIAAVLIFFLRPLVNGLGATESIQFFAMDYVFFILLASPWMVASIVLNQLLRFQGSATIAMAGMLSGAILNIIIDPIFIFTLGLGVRGAAIATMICQIISFSILFFYGCTRKVNIRINFSRFSISLPIYIEMFKGGFPALVRQGFMSVSALLINHFARPYGDAAIAGISIVNRIVMLVNSIVLGFGQGFQPICGFNYGAKLNDRVRKAFWFTVRICSIGLLIISVLLAIFAPYIIALFRRDDLDVIMIGTQALRLRSTSLPFFAYVVMVNMMTQTMGKAFEASIVAASRQGLLMIPCLIAFNLLMGLQGVLIAIPLAEMLSLLIVIPITVRVIRILSPSDSGVNKGEQ